MVTKAEENGPRGASLDSVEAKAAPPPAGMTHDDYLMLRKELWEVKHQLGMAIDKGVDAQTRA